MEIVVVVASYALTIYLFKLIWDMIDDDDDDNHLDGGYGIHVYPKKRLTKPDAA